MSTAAKVRLEKERHPERFCAVKGCLWKIVTPRGPNPCRKHPVQVEPDDEPEYIDTDPSEAYRGWHE